MTYRAPVEDIRFALTYAAGIEDVAALPTYRESAGADLVEEGLIEAVLAEAARLATDVWAPTNVIADRAPPRLEGDAVTVAPEVAAAYRQFAEGGWNSFSFPPAHGGQGLPWVLGMAVNEMWQGANLALGLCPLLTQAAIEAIEAYGSAAQKETYLPKMLSGAWTGTMQMTEPQAGTDLSAIRTIARPQGDHYLMTGQKIFITWGDHDMTENIIHLILAKMEGLPDDNTGLGLFIVPKFLVNDDGSLGRRNDARAVSLEHKLGIHGSPTCVMVYGEEGGAVAHLVGKPGEGLKNMFTMMNNARLGVGLQGVSLCEAAYQHALSYARERVQSAKIGDKSGKRVAIVEHPDVRRMLMTMKATTEAARGLAYYAGAQIDILRHAEDAALRQKAQARVDLLTPLVKAWCTDMAVEMSSIGLQVHGGMGFIEETGAAQYYRDARILPIYEGTNGIQSNDLVFRKLLRDEGAGMRDFLAEMRCAVEAVGHVAHEDASAIAAPLARALAGLEKTTDWMLANARSNTETMAAAAQPYQRQASLVAGGYMMARQARAAAEKLAGNDPARDAHQARIATARFYAEAILPQATGLEGPIMGGHAAAVARDAAPF